MIGVTATRASRLRMDSSQPNFSFCGDRFRLADSGAVEKAAAGATFLP